MTKNEAKAYAIAADDLYGRDGSVEFDEGAEVSEGGDQGAYVQAWVWVTKEQMENVHRVLKSMGEAACQEYLSKHGEAA